MADAKFSIGRLVATAAVDRMMSTGIVIGERFISYLHRHMAGDWGCVDANDVKANDRALIDGTRLLSSYPIDPAKPCEGENRLWIITEADRSVTTLLLPEDY